MSRIKGIAPLRCYPLSLAKRKFDSMNRLRNSRFKYKICTVSGGNSHVKKMAYFYGN